MTSTRILPTIVATTMVLWTGPVAAAGVCPGLSASATGVDANETVTLNPGGGVNDPLEEALVVFFNGPDSEPATITVCEVAENLHPEAEGYIGLPRTLTVEVTFEDNNPENEDTYLMRILIPFDEVDLPMGKEFLGPEATELTFFNQSAWTLGVSGNTVNSPGFAEAVGDRFTVVGTTPPSEFSDEIGDYGLFWHTVELRGFVWANIDHATDFAAGAPLCWADLANDDGIVNTRDFILLITNFGPCVDPPVGCLGDIFFDGVVDVRDLAQLLAFFGTDCFLPPDVAAILHSVLAVDNSAGDAEWGAGAAGTTHLTWDLQVSVDPDDIQNWWTTTEAVATLDDPVYGALTFYQHASDHFWGSGPPSLFWCDMFAAAEFDSWYIEATDLNPCDLMDALPGAFMGDFTEADTELHAIWIDEGNLAPPGPGAPPFTIARYTLLVDVDDADCPDCHLDINIIPSGSSFDPVFGTIEGVTTHRFGLSNLIPFSFDVIDFCAADVDADGNVGIVDFLNVLAQWGNFGTPEDIDRDGNVGILDFLALLANWGPCR